jgi:hypothetical protein
VNWRAGGGFTGQTRAPGASGTDEPGSDAASLLEGLVRVTLARLTTARAAVFAKVPALWSCAGPHLNHRSPSGAQ